jgi:hypothetical protein
MMAVILNDALPLKLKSIMMPSDIITNPARTKVLVQTIKGQTLAPLGNEQAFVTAADDIAGITDSTTLAQRLSLTDASGASLKGPFAVLEFDTPQVGVSSPIFQVASGYYSGFVGNGLTAGGAREFLIPNLLISDLQNPMMRLIP